MSFFRNKPCPKLFFIHIPKTGGMSLEVVLRENYLPEVLSPCYYDVDFVEHPEVDANCRLLYGHHWYCTRELLPADFKVTTFLRNPVDRFYSTYHHVMRAESHYLHDRVAGKGLSPTEVLEEEELRPYFTEVQTKMLGVDYPLKKLLREMKAGDEEEVKNQFNTLRHLAEISEAELENAKKRLAEMAAFGLTSQFDLSMRWLSAAYGLKYKKVPKVNTVPESQKDKLTEVRPEDVEKIIAANPLDVALFNFAEDLFRQKTRWKRFFPY